MKTNLNPRYPILAATLAACAHFSTLRTVRAGTSRARTTCPKTIAERLRTACTMGLLPLLLCALPAAVQAQFTFVTNNGALTITGYTGPGGAVVIPDYTNNMWVTRIAASAFRNNTTMTSVTIPNSVTNIYGGSGVGAFQGCTALTNAIIGDGVISIGQDTFNGCIGLTNITLGNHVNSIGTGAFYNCSKLASITIPDGVTTIGQSAFYNCSKLASVTIPNSTATIGTSAFQGCGALTNAIIGSGVTSFGSSAFQGCTALATVTINNGVSQIGARAFYGCSKLASVTIPDSVITIYGGSGNGAFQNCTALTNAIIGNGVTSIGQDTFNGCIGLTSVTLGNSVLSIGTGAFLNCSKLASITIPDNVATIGQSAFQNCTRLTNAIIGSGVTSFGSSAFQGCTALANAIIGSGVTSFGSSAFQGCTALATVTINNGVTQIGTLAFYGCSKLASVTIPDSVITIYGGSDDGAFQNCTALTNAIIGNGVTSIGQDTFKGCIGLTSVTLGNSVLNIGTGAFLNCSKLASITIPDNVATIGQSAFQNCTSLTNAIIGSGVTSFGSSAFQGCTALASVTISYGVTGIGTSAFNGCTSLITVMIPNSITYIGDYAFAGCAHLTGVYFCGDKPSFGGSSVFTGDNQAIVYYVPGTTGWAGFNLRPTALWNPPTIVGDPQSVTRILGSTATFTVNVTGLAPVAYQWRKDGVPLTDGGNVSGATSSVLTLANVQWADAGQYTVVLSNCAGSVTSRAASLTVVGMAPRFLTQPQSQTVLLGTNVFFSATVTGTPPFSFQWRWNGRDLADGNRISGARSSTLTITNVQAQDVGTYTVVVSSLWGSVTSAPATLRLFSALTLCVSNQTPASFDFTNVDWVEVALCSPFTNTWIWYTLDGSPPSPSSTEYTGPFIVSNTVVVRALAINPADFSTVEMAPAAINLWTAFHLFATATTGGTVALDPPGGFYRSNTMVTLTATSAPGWYFQNWSGDASVTSRTVSVVIDSNKTVLAHFAPLTLLAVTAGGGTIAANPASNYVQDSTVELTAQPQSGWSFLNWMSDASGTNPQASVTMNGPKEVQAVFGTTCYTTVVGQGVVVRNFGTGLVPFGTVVRLTAIPQAGYYFVLWGNAASSAVNPLDFTVTNANPTVGALFSALGANQATLTVLEQGAGVVAREPQANAYPKGQAVRLTAQPFPGQAFLGWSGDASGIQNPLTVTLTTNQTITATFTHRLALAIQPWPGPTQRRGFLVLLAGEEGNTCLVQTSPDLADWQPLTTLTISNTAVQFIDVAVTNQPRRFYRALSVE